MSVRVSRYIVFFSLAVVLFTSACAWQRSQHRSSSVVEYLYPNSQMRTVEPGIPRLQLPLKVGVAFVPANRLSSLTLTENDKFALMKKVSARFANYDFVDTIEPIPSAYLRPRGSFANLDQISRMYDIDVIALLSYDQAQFTDEGIASLAYWTIVGAYIVPGEKNDTHTMLDATVYDISSRKLLFRAPGVHHIDSVSTPINLSEKLREDSREGFHKASEDLTENLDVQLGLFKEKVKQAPENYRVEHRAGYAGGGLNPWLLLVFAGLVLIRRAGLTLPRR